MNKLETTLLLIIQDGKILLAEKMRGFGKGLLNGIGGKVEKNETTIEAMLRETMEEIGVVPTDYHSVGKLYFKEYVKNELTDVCMTVFIASLYDGVVCASEEMSPHWFDLDKIPYDKMFPDDAIWLPLVLEGKKVYGDFEYDEQFNLIKYAVTPSQE